MTPARPQLDCEINGDCEEHADPAERLLVALFDEWYGDKSYRKHDEVARWVKCLREDGLLAADRVDTIAPARLAEIRERVASFRREAMSGATRTPRLSNTIRDLRELLTAYDLACELLAEANASLPEQGVWGPIVLPGPEVRAVTDDLGRMWLRDPNGIAWRTEVNGPFPGHVVGDWTFVLKFAPLADATHHLPPASPVPGEGGQ